MYIDWAKMDITEATSNFSINGHRVHVFPWFTSSFMWMTYGEKFRPPVPFDIHLLQEGDYVHVGNHDSIMWLKIIGMGEWDFHFICTPYKWVVGRSMVKFTENDYFLVEYTQVLRFKRKTKMFAIHNLRQFLENKSEMENEEDDRDFMSKCPQTSPS